ncbi:hypothetical protein [Rubrobacter aplysinae]|uniref:hypothetical protein n=1 Tax=Rubrobacter aplysinae TaxID=909625 RepID=UPI00064BDD42|nr:hypothetical protein [Rubrobacter aplysinae]
MTEYGDSHRDERYRDNRERAQEAGDSAEYEGAERRSFFQRLLFGDGEEDVQQPAGISSGSRELEESEEPRELHGFTVERAASVIKDMPEDVPQKSAVRIVRQTLAAASIEVGELDRATRMREAKLESRIELSRGRVDELNEKTDEVITSLQDQIEKAREARDYGVSEEERKINEARDGLSDVDLVRSFFDIRADERRSEASSDQLAGEAETQGEEFWSERYQEGHEPRGDETEIMDPLEDDTQVFGDPAPEYPRYGEERGEDSPHGPHDPPQDPQEPYEPRR